MDDASRDDPIPTATTDDAQKNDQHAAAGTTRRDFLKASVAAVAAPALSSCWTETYDARGLGAAPLDQFDHLVVVMFENRSLDNILGYLYEPGTVPRNQTFDGVAGALYSNPVPSYINDGHTSVSVRMSPGTDADFMNPNPDPGEEYQHVNTQLYNIVNPPGNEKIPASQMQPPWNAPEPGQTPTMQGFVHDYCSDFYSINGRLPTFDEYRVIMDCFGPTQLPVINTLAREFAVYDAWFCAVPTQTLPNRSFFHASSSSGFVDNQSPGGYSKWVDNDATTIFNRLSDAGLSWRVYYDATQLVPLTALIHAPALFPYWKTNFATMETFYADVANGTLPAYAFVEPRMLFNHNDMHPPAPFDPRLPIGATSDVRAGDLLLHQIYSAVKASASQTGSNALNTMLMVTFDEHGGTFDHVPPGPAVTPQLLQPEGELGFFFNRLGCRVPTIAISAYTEANTVIHREMNHGSVIRTLCEKHTLPFLTQRDRRAPDISDAINLTQARAPSSWPVTVPPPVPPDALITDPLSPRLAPLPLNDLERTIVGLAMAIFNGVEPGPNDMPKTLGDAYVLLQRISAGAFR